MLGLKQIEAFYPEKLKPFKQNILREYLQYKILEIIYSSEFEEKLVFMGGTAVRILHGNTRFSEDLDFDNVGLSHIEFDVLAETIRRTLGQEGYAVETKNIFRSAYTCIIKISDLLFDYGLTSHQAEKILIKINAEPQNANYQPEKVIINKFDVFLRINTVPAEILLAQKLSAVFGRKRAMGRDFYDVVFLLGKTKPNLDYLKLKLKVKDGADLKQRLLQKCDTLDFDKLAKDVEEFLFEPSDAKKVRYFCDYIEGISF